MPIEEQQDSVREELVVMQMKAGKWKWIGHSIRKDSFVVEECAFSWSPQGKRRRGGLRRNWRRMVEKTSGGLGRRRERSRQ